MGPVGDKSTMVKEMIDTKHFFSHNSCYMTPKGHGKLPLKNGRKLRHGDGSGVDPMRRQCTLRVNFVDKFWSVRKTIVVNSGGRPSNDLIAICRLYSEFVSSQVPAPCGFKIIVSVRHNIRSLRYKLCYLRKIWRSCHGSLIIEFQPFVYIRLFYHRRITSELMETVELSEIPWDIQDDTEKDNPLHRFQVWRGELCKSHTSVDHT